jgi:hypothetical protein
MIGAGLVAQKAVKRGLKLALGEDLAGAGLRWSRIISPRQD